MSSFYISSSQLIRTYIWIKFAIFVSFSIIHFTVIAFCLMLFWHTRKWMFYLFNALTAQYISPVSFSLGFYFFFKIFSLCLIPVSSKAFIFLRSWMWQSSTTKHKDILGTHANSFKILCTYCTHCTVKSTDREVYRPWCKCTCTHRETCYNNRIVYSNSVNIHICPLGYNMSICTHTHVGFNVQFS